MSAGKGSHATPRCRARELGTDPVAYDDHGEGPPVVLIHGYPLDGRSFEKQEAALLAAGHRVITYDRRGFSMGTGEVTRYLGTYGSNRVRRAVLLGPIPPFLLATDDNRGPPQELLDGFTAAVLGDRPAFMTGFLSNFYNYDVYRGSLVSEDRFRASWNTSTSASAIAEAACIGTWLTDFRDDLPKIDVPVLVLQGEQDRILPPEHTGNRLPELLKDVTHVTVPGGPHAIIWTHADQVNAALVDFFGSSDTEGPA